VVTHDHRDTQISGVLHWTESLKRLSMPE
jgi:hypothetical protein